MPWPPYQSFQRVVEGCLKLRELNWAVWTLLIMNQFPPSLWLQPPSLPMPIPPAIVVHWMHQGWLFLHVLPAGGSCLRINVAYAMRNAEAAVVVGRWEASWWCGSQMRCCGSALGHWSSWPSFVSSIFLWPQSRHGSHPITIDRHLETASHNLLSFVIGSRTASILLSYYFIFLIYLFNNTSQSLSSLSFTPTKDEVRLRVRVWVSYVPPFFWPKQPPRVRTKSLPS